ncbi:MAG TPA: aspartate aminotransferase family protein [Candidatus Dormibacteraeota bacterium]|jgi:glutamate-1-semialdehyde 2,1-aminomutase|nr:aspartate aminotransferase family protein [Candidatus Dormibacteraeota bacterium]
MTDPETVYVERNPVSRALHERARRSLAGGTTRTTTYFDPFPVYLTRGEGARIWDADGNQRLDFICNYTALILGHAHPRVTAAVREAAGRGTAFAAPNPHEVELAELLCERVPSVERVRFCNSGTEATMFAMRLARAFTGRPKLARIEGGYHGTHDLAEVSAHPDPDLAGPPDTPLPVPDSPGTPPWAVEATVVLPYNAPDAAERILRAHADELAGVIVEPVIGRPVIPAEPEFLERLRRVTRELGMLLIFDEVISLRLAPGGAQSALGVIPDLTTMGKIIGGGLPVAAFGGRREVMELLDPRAEAPIAQGGTYNGNPLGMAAGLAAMRELTPEIYEDLNRRGERLADQAREVFATHGVPVQVNSAGSLFAFHFTDRPVRDYRSAAAADRRRGHELFLGLLNQGVMLAPRGMGCLCTAHGEAETERFLDALEAVVAERAPAWRG